MGSLQISQDSKRLLDTKTKLLLALIFISLPVFLFLPNNSRFLVFDQPHIIQIPQETAQIISSQLSSGDVTPLIVDEQNNSSISSKISSNLTDPDKQNNPLNTSEISSNHTSASDDNSSSEALNAGCKVIRAPDEQKNSSKASKIISKTTSDQHIFDDELIASGFDKESCISRYETSTYRKYKPYKPIPYLISKLRSYEELHARCGPQSSSYKKIIRKLSKSQRVRVNQTLKCKYIVWTPANGLGNRMLSMVSAFLYSILQNRVLLVEFESDMDGLFCEPFPNSTWLLPQKFPHKNHWSQLPEFKYRANSEEAGFLPSFMHLNIQHGHGDYNIQHFHCNETHPFLEKIPVLILQSDQYFIPSLFISSFFKEELNRMFPDRDAVFHHLGRYLFNPSNDAWGLITRFYQAYLAKADEKIGLQIRVFNHKEAVQKDIMSQILACTQTQNILPTLDDKRNSFNLLSQNWISKSKAILVASLYHEYAGELKNMYWARPTINGDVIGVYQPSHEELQKFGDNVHNMKALAEIYLLSLCDVLLTSPLSTFGYVAQSLGGLQPWVLDSLEWKGIPDPPCKKGFSMEPCFHVPPQYDCEGKTKIENITAVYPELKPCEDVWWGVKLF